MSNFGVQIMAHGPVAALLRKSRVAVVAACVCFVALASVPAAAEEEQKPDPSKVVATIDGDEITETDLVLTARDLAETLAQYPDDQKARIVLNFLIDQSLMAAAAEEKKLQETQDFRDRMEVMRKRTLRDLYFDQAIRESITDEAVRKSYDEIAANIRAEIELHARHILVKTEDEAKAVKAELDGGADFVELAKKKSVGPTGPKGGDLDYISKDDVVPEFWAEASGLNPGEVSAPVKSGFGWHVIKVEDKRSRTPPEFEEVKDVIAQQLERARYFEVIGELKKNAKIDILIGGDAAQDETAPDKAQDQEPEKK